MCCGEHCNQRCCCVIYMSTFVWYFFTLWIRAFLLLVAVLVFCCCFVFCIFVACWHCTLHNSTPWQSSRSGRNQIVSCKRSGWRKIAAIAASAHHYTTVNGKEGGKEKYQKLHMRNATITKPQPSKPFLTSWEAEKTNKKKTLEYFIFCVRKGKNIYIILCGSLRV